VTRDGRRKCTSGAPCKGGRGLDKPGHPTTPGSLPGTPALCTGTDDPDGTASAAPARCLLALGTDNLNRAAP
jgi:hypothetical protein